MNHRIAMLTTLHPHDDIRIYHKESKALAQAGWRVEIYNPRMEAAGEYGIRFRRLILPSTRTIRLLRGRSIAYRALFESRADLFMLHDPELLPLLRPLQLAGRRTIYDAHEDLPAQLLEKDWIPIKMRPAAARFGEGQLQRWLPLCRPESLQPPPRLPLGWENGLCWCATGLPKRIFSCLKLRWSAIG